MIQREQQLIRTAVLSMLVVLVLVYLLVYSVYYHPASSVSLGSDSPQKQQSSWVSIVNTPSSVMVSAKNTPQESQTLSVGKVGEDGGANVGGSVDSESPRIISRGDSGISAADLVLSDTKVTQDQSLPWAELTPDRTIADEIGVEYRYALRDEKGIYYMNLGSSKQDLAALLQNQWWNTFVLNTPTKILANQLFGSRVEYLNIPMYKNKTVLMVITIGGERRLIQVPYDIYHESKEHIAKKFA